MNLAVLTTGGATKVTLQAGRRTTGFIEREKCLFAVPRGFSGALLVDEIVLELDAKRAHWEWEPGFFAGTAVVELRDAGDAKVADYLIDVSPDPGKLGRDLFEEMATSLRDANAVLLLGTEPSAAKIGASGGRATLNAEYLRLKFYSRAYLDSLREISERPIYRLNSSRRLGTLAEARRIDAQSIRSATRNAGAAFAIRNADAEPDEVRLDLPHLESTLDNGANRAMRYFLDAVLTRLKQVSAALLLDAQHDSGSATATEMRLRWPERRRFLEAVGHALERRVRTDPFATVTSRELTAEGLNAIAGHPVYARAQRLAWSILRTGVGGDADERQSLTTTWEIFERWCFLRIAEQVSLAVDCKFEPQHISFDDGCLARYVIRSGSEVVDVRLQERFAAYGGNLERVSLSRERVPDITVRLFVDRELRSWAALDAKYSVRRSSVLEAMSSAHIYHDSLRLHGRRPDYALLLLPARPEPEWLCDNAFIEEHRVGAIAFSDDLSDGRTLLNRLRASPQRV